MIRARDFFGGSVASTGLMAPRTRRRARSSGATSPADSREWARLAQRRKRERGVSLGSRGASSSPVGLAPDPRHAARARAGRRHGRPADRGREGVRADGACERDG